MFDDELLGMMDAVLATMGGAHCMLLTEGAGTAAGAWRGVARELVADEGGRCGCIAGEALTGVVVVVMGLRVGDRMLAAVCCMACCWAG